MVARESHKTKVHREGAKTRRVSEDDTHDDLAVLEKARVTLGSDRGCECLRQGKMALSMKKHAEENTLILEAVSACVKRRSPVTDG